MLAIAQYQTITAHLPDIFINLQCKTDNSSFVHFHQHVSSPMLLGIFVVSC